MIGTQRVRARERQRAHLQQRRAVPLHELAAAPSLAPDALRLVRAAHARRTMLVRDRKSGFCLADHWGAAPGNWPGRRPHFLGDCEQFHPEATRVVMGTTPGYTDRYPAFFHGQNIDITGVPAGVYDLTHRVNATMHLRELRYDNNAASVRVRLRWRDGYPTVRVLRSCPATANLLKPALRVPRAEREHERGADRHQERLRGDPERDRLVRRGCRRRRGSRRPRRPASRRRPGRPAAPPPPRTRRRTRARARSRCRARARRAARRRRACAAPTTTATRDPRPRRLARRRRVGADPAARGGSARPRERAQARQGEDDAAAATPGDRDHDQPRLQPAADVRDADRDATRAVRARRCRAGRAGRARARRRRSSRAGACSAGRPRPAAPRHSVRAARCRRPKRRRRLRRASAPRDARPGGRAAASPTPSRGTRRA